MGTFEQTKQLTCLCCSSGLRRNPWLQAMELPHTTRLWTSADLSIPVDGNNDGHTKVKMCSELSTDMDAYMKEQKQLDRVIRREVLMVAKALS